MEFDEDENGVGGIVPEYGAIFMSNTATKGECFKRKFFGLPSAQAKFVKQVKAGMLLFLFEYEKRELHGVFQATSDGAMNIMPHAFGTFGKQFPAQVRFTLIWYCIPLPEYLFRDALRDNYYSAKKFNFGLSKDQVRMLLKLFNSRRLNKKMPRSQVVKEIGREVGNDRRSVNDRVMLSDTLEDGTEDFIRHHILNEHSEHFSGRAEGLDDDKFLTGDKFQSKHIGIDQSIRTDDPSVYGTKKRKISTNVRFLLSDATELYSNCAPQHVLRTDRPDNTLGNIRSSDDMWILSSDRVKDYDIGSAISSEYPINSFDRGRRVTADNRFLMNQNVEKKFDVDYDFGPVELQDKPFSEVGRVSEDNRFPKSRYTVGNEHSLDDVPRQVISDEYLLKYAGKNRPDDKRLLMNNMFQKDLYFGGGLGSVFSSEHIGNSLREVARATDCETFLSRDGAKAEHDMESTFGAGISTEFSRYNTMSKDKLVAEVGGFQKRDTVENVLDRGNCIQPAFSSDIPAFCQSEQGHLNSIKCDQSEKNLFINSLKPNTKSDSFLLHDQLRCSSVFDGADLLNTMTRSFSSSHDAVITRSVPYDPEFPDCRYTCSSHLVGSHKLGSAQDHSSHRVSEENFHSSLTSEGLTHFLDSNMLARCYDVASGSGGRKFSFPNRYNFENHSGHRSSNKILNSGLFESSESRTSARDSFLASPSFPNVRSIEKINDGALSHAIRSRECPSLASGNEYMRGGYVIEIPQIESYRACSSDLYRGSYPQDQGKSLSRHESKFHPSAENRSSDTRNGRTSVFARLGAAPEICIHGDNSHIDVVNDGCDMDASVDGVMDLLHQAHNHWVKVNKHRPSVKSNNGNENVRYKEKSKFYKQTVIEQPLGAETTMEIDANHSNEENGVSVLKETRQVDFKRRSKIKRNMNDMVAKVYTGSCEGTMPLDNGKGNPSMGNTSLDTSDKDLMAKKRKIRNLLRPNFGKKECLDEGKNGDSTLHQRSPCQESSCKNDASICKEFCKNKENNEMPSLGVGMVHATPPTNEISEILSLNVGEVHASLPTICEDNNNTLDQNSQCKLRSRKIFGATFSCRDCSDGEELSQDVKIDNIATQGPPNEKNENVRADLRIEDRVKVSIQDLLSMIGSNPRAKDSCPVLTEVFGNSNGKEELEEENYSVTGVANKLNVRAACTTSK